MRSNGHESVFAFYSGGKPFLPVIMQLDQARRLDLPAQGLRRSQRPDRFSVNALAQEPAAQPHTQ